MDYPGLLSWVEKKCAIDVSDDPDHKTAVVKLQIRTGRTRSGLRTIKGDIRATSEVGRDVYDIVVEALNRNRGTFERLVLVEARYQGESNPFDSFPVTNTETHDLATPEGAHAATMSTLLDMTRLVGGILERREVTYERITDENAELKAENRELAVMGEARKQIAEAQGQDRATIAAIEAVSPLIQLATYKMWTKMKERKAKGEPVATDVPDDEKGEAIKAFDGMIETLAEMMKQYSFLPTKDQAKVLFKLYQKHA